MHHLRIEPRGSPNIALPKLVKATRCVPTVLRLLVPAKSKSPSPAAARRTLLDMNVNLSDSNAGDLDQERTAVAVLASDVCNVCEIERRHRDL